MKDKELRNCLQDGGFIEMVDGMECTYLKPLNLVDRMMYFENCLQALEKHLSVTFEKGPKIVVKVESK